MLTWAVIFLNIIALNMARKNKGHYRGDLGCLALTIPADVVICYLIYCIINKIVQ
jgi:hypothetical protein